MTDSELSIQNVNDNLVFKILVIGDVGVGKTSLIKRYVQNIYSDSHKSTIGVDFAMKKIIHNNIVISAQLWDIAGQERYSNMTRVYYKESHGAIIVYDVNKDDTFETVKKWKYDLDSKLIAYSNRKIPIILLANKIDIRNDNVNLDDYCKENNIDAWFATSAKENIGISDSIQKLISIIYEHKDEIIETPRTNIIKMKKQENNDCCYY